MAVYQKTEGAGESPQEGGEGEGEGRQGQGEGERRQRRGGRLGASRRRRVARGRAWRRHPICATSHADAAAHGERQPRGEGQRGRGHGRRQGDDGRVGGGRGRGGRRAELQGRGEKGGKHGRRDPVQDDRWRRRNQLGCGGRPRQEVLKDGGLRGALQQGQLQRGRRSEPCRAAQRPGWRSGLSRPGCGDDDEPPGQVGPRTHPPRQDK
mmetsp:Transcript_26347/g.70335  ORF Transcript_26347/g.70335 Transcript_26347/m.70335 type:complete len:209 (-) Transcript_26347:310-936(-)